MKILIQKSLNRTVKVILKSCWLARRKTKDIIVIIIYFDSYDFDYTMRRFCNHISNEGHRKPLQFFDPKYPTMVFYIFDREELEEWFACICRKDRMICDYW